MTAVGEKEAVEWLKKKLVPKQPPRGQYKGFFSKGPRAYVACPICTQMAVSSNPEYAGTVATAKQTQRQHMEDHKYGRIRKPTLVSA